MFAKTFSSLKYRNYRLFFFGQLVSLVGTWMQWTAQGWLVYQLTSSKAMLGIISACGTVPMLVFSIVGGMTADRYSKRNILLCTQTIMMITALILGGLVLWGHVRVWHIALLAAVSGMAAAFDMPTRQAFIGEVVEKDDLMNAIGLNSSIFNSARIIGPAVAGFVMAEVAIGWCFMINGLSFLAVLVGLMMMKFDFKSEIKLKEPILKEIYEGLVYVYRKREMFSIFLSVSVMGIFGWSYATLLPAFARDVLKVEAKGYGFMLTVGGLGALLAALSVATVSDTKRARRMMVTGILMFSIAAAIFSWSSNYILSVSAMAVASYGITSFLACANTSVQAIVSDDMRGRIMGIWTFVFGGMMPLGSLQIGFVGEKLGPQWAVFIGAVICLAFVIFLEGYRVKKLEKAV